MKWILETLLLFAAFFLGLRLMGAVVAQRDAEVWLRQPEGSELRLQGVEVSHPLFGGLQVRTPDGRVMTYPDAAVVMMKFALRPYTWAEKLTWAPGDASGLKVVPTPLGRIGVLICGENTNTLARFSLLAQGERTGAYRQLSVALAAQPYQEQSAL